MGFNGRGGRHKIPPGPKPNRMKRFVTRVLPSGETKTVYPFHVCIKGAETAVHCRDDEDYDDGSLSGTIAPKDVALAWGAVAEYNDRIDFNWEQSNRWYYWHVNDVGVLGPVGGEDGVSTHSANTHLIPADSRVKDDVMKIKQGDHIKLTGYLVNVDGSKPDGQTFYWYSSTTRDDTGDGACEVMYVESVSWLD